MVEPRTRLERFKATDRAAHEKEMLRNRKGGFFQVSYNEGMINPFEQVEGSAARQDERTRAASTAYREEINREEEIKMKRLKEIRTENYRQRILERENDHWDLIERQAAMGAASAAEKRHNCRPESYVSYDVLTGEDKHNADKIRAHAKELNRQDYEIEGTSVPRGLKQVITQGYGASPYEENPISNRRCIFGADGVTYMNYAYNVDHDRREQHDEHYHDDEIIARRGTFAGYDIKPKVNVNLQEVAIESGKHSDMMMHERRKDKSYLTGKIGQRESRMYLQDEPDFVDHGPLEPHNHYTQLAREQYFVSAANPFLYDAEDNERAKSRGTIGAIRDGYAGPKTYLRHQDFDPREKEGRKRPFQPETWWYMRENDSGEPHAALGEPHTAHQDRTSFKKGSFTLDEENPGERLSTRLENHRWAHSPADISGERRAW